MASLMLALSLQWTHPFVGLFADFTIDTVLHCRHLNWLLGIFFLSPILEKIIQEMKVLLTQLFNLVLIVFPL